MTLDRAIRNRAKTPRACSWRTAVVRVGILLHILLAFFCARTAPAASDSQFMDVSYQVGILRSWDLQPFGPLWADLDGDGRQDLVFMNHGEAPSIYINQQGHGFWDCFPWSGLSMEESYDEQQDRHGCSCADYDNDGRVDLFIAHGAHRRQTLGTKFDELLRNRGDLTFQIVTREAGVLNQDGRGRGGHWIDFDNDGNLDLHISNFRTADRLHINNGDGTFTDVTTALKMPEGSDVSAWLDLDQDGWVDLVTAPPLRLFRNRAGTGFMEVPGTGASIESAPRSMACGDYDQDGRTDLFLTSNRAGESRLLRNNGRGFSLVEDDFGPVEVNSDGTAVWGDLDNDGDLDLLVTDISHLWYFTNTDGSLVPLSPGAATEVVPGAGANIALGDYDGDGYLDIALHTAQRQYLLRNLNRGNNWLLLDLVGTTSNRSGFGARIRISDEAGLVVFREYMGDMGGDLSRGCGPLHFGLGQARQVDIRVRWPSGRDTILERVSANQRLVIEEE